MIRRRISLWILLLAFLTIVCESYSQKEANIWYFGEWAGLDFTNGEPVPIAGIYDDDVKSANICDSAGNFIIGTSGYRMYNKNGSVMPNGYSIVDGEDLDYNTVIVKKPGSDHLYYVFLTVYWDDYPMPFGLYYAVVDMQLDGGLGDVTNEKGILIEDAWDAEGKLLAVHHENGEDIWIIVRKVYESGYASFLLTSEGIFQDYVFSPSIEPEPGRLVGDMKVSHDKKMLVAAYRGQTNLTGKPRYEICDFDATSGEVDLKYTIVHPYQGSYVYRPLGVEFSPDSKYLYLSGEHNWTNVAIFQHKTQYYQDSAQFFDSGIKICEGPGNTLQLGRDGKIYCNARINTEEAEYVSVIHDPWKDGLDCNYEAEVIHLDFDEQDRAAEFYFPNQFTDYLFRFGWEGLCQSDVFQFQSNFEPEPIYTRWRFDDPGSGADSISFELNPLHQFSAAGEYEVYVYVKYPNGRIEETSRVVSVGDTPHPGLGPGHIICEGEEVTLYAGEEEGMYAWSTGDFGYNVNEIVVSDSGWYWVQVTADNGCFGIDSVYVDWYAKAAINEEGLTIIPTTCGGSNGKILGLQVTGDEPLSFEWYDADSNYLANTLDLTDIAVGNYYLHILDGNGCTTISNAYTITDAGDIEISTVETEDAHCNQDDAEIRIGAVSLATGYLLYSIDNGNTWQQNDSLFSGLSAGNYYIRVSDTSGCESVYENNPVVIENILGPEVTAVSTTPEIDNLSDGVIDIAAITGEGQLHFSLDNGLSFQTDNGLFTNLPAGTYHCMVKDDFRCDTTFVVELERIISQLIEAIAGDGNACIGNAAVVPLKLNNFTGIFKFHVKLTYDTAILNCDGYIKVHPDLEDNLLASIIPGTDEVIISWQGESAVTLEENATMLELVFGTKEEGASGIDWAASPGESVFYNDLLEEVNADYHLGILRVYSWPRILMNKEEVFCEGDDVTAFVMVVGGSGEVDYFWEGPDGFTSAEEHLQIKNVHTGQAGIYTLTVNDTLDCQESKDINLIVIQNPEIAFADHDTIYAEPNFILEAGSGYDKYLWNTGDTTDAIQVYNEGLYSVFVTSAESCKSTDSVTVLWGGEPFYLPNAFTPNGDGLNDEFKAVQRYDFVKTYHLSIYSRWGEMIFETSDIDQGWNGTYKGNPAQQGSYVYKIVYTAYLTGKETQVKTGIVTLIK